MRITFTLRRAEPIELTLQGPSPSCREAGTVRLEGERGKNRLDFRGRIRSKAVRPGVYILTLASVASGRPVVRPLVVLVVSSRRTILVGDATASADRCAAGALPSPSASFLPATPFAAPPPKLPLAAAPEPVAEPAPPKEPQNEVLGIGVPALPQLQEVIRPDEPLALTLAKLLVFVALPLIAIVAMLRRVRARHSDELY